MTQKLIFTSLILISFFSCKTNPKETLITGKVIGDLPAEIIYTNPINGICDWNFTQSVETDSLGVFQISMNIENPVFIKLLIIGSSLTEDDCPIIVAESGKKYELYIDTNKKENSFFVKGEIVNVQHYYNNLSRINPRSCLYSFGKDISDMNGLKTDLKEDKQKKISAITAFYENGEITEQVYQLLKTDSEVYYGVALSTLASMNNIGFHNQNTEVPEQVFEIWQEASSLISTKDQSVLRTANIYDYLYLNFWYHIYTEIKYENFAENRAKYREENKGQTYTLSIANELFENEILEFFTAQYIISNLRRTGTREGDNEFPLIIDKFKEHYPKSEYNDMLEVVKEKFITGN